MPGPPPEHPRLRLLKGNPGKRPMRSPPEPARAEQCPEPPEHLTGYAREVWIHLAPELHKLSLLTILDIGPFSAYCCAYARWQEAKGALQRSGELTIKTAKGHLRVNPLVRIASQAMADMRWIGAEFGLSPNALTAKRHRPAASAEQVRWAAEVNLVRSEEFIAPSFGTAAQQPTTGVAEGY
jgi:P27 family predicted phage terminase small subunit